MSMEDAVPGPAGWHISEETWEYLYWQAFTGIVFVKFSQLEPSRSLVDEEAIAIWRTLLEHILDLHSLYMPYPGN